MRYSLITSLAFSPAISFGQDLTLPSGLAVISADILKPEKLFDALKKNITLPISGATSTLKNTEIPSPGQTLDKVSPQLQEINRDVREETGIDLSKFLSWFAKILKAFFQIIVALLEKVSQALKS